MEQDIEIVREFLVESAEGLDELDRAFVALESNPGDRTRIGAIFRTIHSIKGTSGFLAYTKLEALAHAGEELLSLLRDGKMSLTPPVTTALLGMVDGIRRILSSIEATGTEGDASFDAIIDGLKALRAGEAPRAAAALVKAPAGAPAQDVTASPEAPRAEGHGAADSTVRVDVQLLDKLMNLVGELVLARNQMLQVGASGRDAAFTSAAQRLNLITTELQEGVMKTRMRPIGSLWNKLPRVVRDLAVMCGKEVHLEMEGAGTELDRTILEAIKDPLTHVVRNSVDHGIEPIAQRLQRGKAAQGRLCLRAFHEGGKVNIEIADDGGGIDPDRVRAKALEKGLVTPERAAQMADRELVNLVFAPGFSTAERVSNISGRGVGMDVVKTNIERIGGSLELDSVAGRGTTIKIRIPLTLAIIPALVVHMGDERYAIPQVNLLELVRLEGDQCRTRIEHVHGARVMRLRGNLLPLVDIRDVLGGVSARSSESDAVNVVVVQADDRQFGLMVDGVSDTEEIVVKPLDRELKGINTFAGATIMGDGKVALILDVVGFAQRAGVVSAGREKARSLTSSGGEAVRAAESLDTLLLLEHGEGQRVALPLSYVSRLEEVQRASVERAGIHRVIQYRGQILPLISLAEILGTRQDPSEEAFQVVVFSDGDLRAGLIVGRILDIVHESVAVKKTGARPGVRGTAVIQGRVTELLDVGSAFRGHVGEMS